ncbi:hypothetical protein CDAR_311561 [Caerostris darwini]|uniref:Uncharacterized protein n=1 Tax=Caerostris darwini TaxID=1538125 RepID=A0AAV4UTD4_9ARAC|nr:hypothetical protein CDAR_311561 [Caerostris darwini]
MVCNVPGTTGGFPCTPPNDSWDDAGVSLVNHRGQQLKGNIRGGKVKSRGKVVMVSMFRFIYFLYVEEFVRKLFND